MCSLPMVLHTSVLNYFKIALKLITNVMQEGDVLMKLKTLFEQLKEGSLHSCVVKLGELTGINGGGYVTAELTKQYIVDLNIPEHPATEKESIAF